ncbi:MAG: hypothetical protein V6Z89_07200 [Desulfobacter sp.]
MNIKDVSININSSSSKKSSSFWGEPAIFSIEILIEYLCIYTIIVDLGIFKNEIALFAFHRTDIFVMNYMAGIYQFK